MELNTRDSLVFGSPEIALLCAAVVAMDLGSGKLTFAVGSAVATRRARAGAGRSRVLAVVCHDFMNADALADWVFEAYGR